MTRIIIFLLAVVVTIFAAPETDADLYAAAACDETKCLLPDCKCSSTSPPDGIEIGSVPQFVFLTFDDDVSTLYDTYSPLFLNKSNPDGCPISVTYFVSHEYTDYDKVHDLYVRGHEVALHSISHVTDTDYWKDIPIEDLQHEFGDEIVLISKFANIPEDAMKGMRLPFLQLAGSRSFQVAKDIGLSYDCSWPTHTFRKPGLWPYTLDYKSIQDCEIAPCPEDSIPGLWVFPMIDWTDQQNIVCSMTDACVNIPDDADQLFQWMVDNFNVQYQGNRAPFGFYIHPAWFVTNPVHLVAYGKFVDYLQTLNDVYVSSISNALKWIQNPVPIGSSNWPECPQREDLGCEVTECPLPKTEDWGEEIIYLIVCGPCPPVYPWLGNPLGEVQ